MLIFFGLALVIAMLACVFALQNAQPVSVIFLAWNSPNVSLALILLLTFALGAVGALLACIPTMIKGRLEIGELQKQLAALQGGEPPKETDEDSPAAQNPAPTAPAKETGRADKPAA